LLLWVSLMLLRVSSIIIPKYFWIIPTKHKKVWHFNRIVNFIVFLSTILSHISSKNYKKVIDGIFHKYGCSYFNRIFIIKLSWNIPWYISDGICDRRFCWQIRLPCSHWRKMNRKVSKLICCPNNALFYLFLYIYIYIYIYIF